MYDPKLRNNTIHSSMLGAAATSGFLMDEYKRTKEESEKMPWCDCTSLYSGGEMSPRLWICKTHGRSGFSYILRIISKYAKDAEIPEDDAWDIADNFLDIKKGRDSLGRATKIYFCEDHFENDLEEHFHELLNPTILEISKGFFKRLFG